MTVYGSGSVAFLLVDGYSVLGDTTDISDTFERITEDTTPLGATAEQHALVGVSRIGLTQNGFYNDAVLAADAAYVALGSTARVILLGYEGNTIGKRTVGFSGLLEGSYARQASRGALHKASAGWVGNGQREEGFILHALGAETAAGNTQLTPVVNAASSANGGSGYVECTALTLGGYTNIVVKVRHSPDNATYADLITFTAITAAPAAQRAVVAGTVDRYLASSIAFSGAGAGPSATFAVAFARS